MSELLRVALAEHAAAQERAYFDEESDRAAAEQYYAEIEPEYEALSKLLESTHREQPHYSPAVELYPWVDLQPDGKIRSLYTDEEYDPERLIEEAAETHERREALRAENTGEAAVEELAPYNCEHTVCQSWFEHAEPMRGDLHHLFACERKCNSFRGNTPYTDFPDYLEVVPRGVRQVREDRLRAVAGQGPGCAGDALLHRFATRSSGSIRRRRSRWFSAGTRPSRSASGSSTATPQSSSARGTGTR